VAMAFHFKGFGMLGAAVLLITLVLYGPKDSPMVLRIWFNIASGNETGMPENPSRDLCITSKTLTQIDPGEKNRAPDLVPGGKPYRALFSWGRPRVVVKD
jgi:hypothetical protein